MWPVNFCLPSRFATKWNGAGGRPQSITERYNFTDDSRIIPSTGGALDRISKLENRQIYSFQVQILILDVGRIGLGPRTKLRSLMLLTLIALNLLTGS